MYPSISPAQPRCGRLLSAVDRSAADSHGYFLIGDNRGLSSSDLGPHDRRRHDSVVTPPRLPTMFMKPGDDRRVPPADVLADRPRRPHRQVVEEPGQRHAGGEHPHVLVHGPDDRQPVAERRPRRSR